jgi:predicted GH43/DUF377 family glycosyl hydrolase
MQLTRCKENPILTPALDSEWECYNVFNPGVIFHNGLFHMFYRAQGVDWVSRIGYAVSSNGICWNRMRNPVLEPQDSSDARGVEDARITRIDDSFYMTYTAYGYKQPSERADFTHTGGWIMPMIAQSINLIEWRRIAPIVTGEDNKDHVLFPKKVNGKFAVFHRRRPFVWLAYSEDLIHWPTEWMTQIYGPRDPGSWDGNSVGSNGVPIETEHGWLVINHGYDEKHIYRLGVILLDLDKPDKVISRPRDPIFEPKELWELRGDVPNVVFSCANPVVGDTVYVFYGGADHVIGLATCALSDLIDYARHG